MKIKSKSRQGSVLFTVLVVSMMMMVLVAAGISLVGHTNTRTNKEYRLKQAYFMASSCLEGFVTEATTYSAEGSATDEQARANIQMLQDIATSGEEIDVKVTDKLGNELSDVYQRGMGSCKIKLEENGSENNLKAIATAEYLGEKQTVVAYFSIKPISDKQPMNNALEIIGTDGGGNNGYNNVEVYGNTAASEIESHNKNTWYNLNANDSKFRGDMTMLGSVTISTGFTLGSNPYYISGSTENLTPGGSLTVSRSLTFGNRASALSDLTKDSTNNDEPTYNYINVGECLIMGGVSNTKVGSSNTTQVDIYASSIVFGKLSSAPAALQNAVKSSVQPAEKVGDYASAMEGERGQEQTVYGNIYTYDVGGEFNGNIYFNGINNHIYGDIYSSGDVYVNVSSSQLDFSGTLYILPGKHVYPEGAIRNVVERDWTNDGGRSKRPAINTTEATVQQYVYYPEHMLCQSGVSSIKETYAAMYDSSNNIKSTVKEITDESFRNTSGAATTDSDGNSVTFDYIVTESCVLNYTDNKKILIDVDNAVMNEDGRHDIVVILKNGGNMGNENLILVRNSTTEDDGDNQRFCYFVSDSGVGTTNDEYSADNSSKSTYDHDTFKTSTFTFGGTQRKLMDFESYTHSSFYNGANKVNPTDQEISDAYSLGKGNIIFLLTEGCTLSTSPNNMILQASIYAPRATINFQRGTSMNIVPLKSDGSYTNVGIIGAVICNQFITSANNVGIVYQEVSPNSMLPKAKGSKQIYTSGFKLVKYSNS